MTIKEYLSYYNNFSSKIRLNRDKIASAEALRNEFVFVPRIQNDISDYQDRLYEDTENLVRIRFQIEHFINNCPCTDTEKEVLQRRYILSQTWESISEIMLYSVQHLHRIEAKALKKIHMPSVIFMPELCQNSV